MSKETYARMLGIFMMLSLALAGLMIVPEGISAEESANLIVLVKDQKEKNLDSAMVNAVNVHTGMEYVLSWTGSEFVADVIPGTYQIFASANGYISPMEAQMVMGISLENDDDPQIIIKLTEIDNSADVKIQVMDGSTEVEMADVHLFGADGVHLMMETSPKGWANFSTPNGDLHLLVMEEDMLVYSEIITVNNTYMDVITLEQEPAGDGGSYRIMGQVMNGTKLVGGLNVNLWDSVNNHMLPEVDTDDGALSIPLYDSVFHLLVEADGYEPLWVSDIDLTTSPYFYRPTGNVFEMFAIETEESWMTTIDLTGDDGFANPTIETVWTMDANSMIYGTPNAFGNPRMQASGSFYSAGWLTLDGTEVDEVESDLASFGPFWMTTGDFFQVNNEDFTAEGDYTVALTGFEGDITEIGANPVATLSSDYTSALEMEDGDDIRVEVYSIFEHETLEIVLPDNYEILGSFGEKAEFPDDNTSRLLVYEPLEFNAKKEVRPVADLDFVISKDSYKVDDMKYIVMKDVNVTLTAEGSYDMVGDIVEYHWMGIPANAMIWIDDELVSIDQMTLDMEEITIQLVANSADYLNITLQIVDSSGLESEDVDYILIMPDEQKPAVSDYTLSQEVDEDEWELMSAPYKAPEDVNIKFNASASDNGEIVAYIWTFSDDSGSLNGQIVDKRFADPGVYEIQLTVKDAVGNEIVVENRTISINDTTKPMSVIKPFEVDIKVGESFELNGTQSYDPRTSGDVTENLTYAWSYYTETDDGNQTTIGTGDVRDYSFTKPGTYRLVLNVTDKDGNFGVSEKTLVIYGVDLIVENVEFTKPKLEDLQDGEKTKMSVLIKNLGEVDCDTEFTIILTINGKEKKSETLESLESGGFYYWNITWDKLDLEGDKTYEFKVIVDSDAAVDEGTEDNNEMTLEAYVKDKEPWFHWWMVVIVVAILLVVYVVYMKYTRQQWGYEPIMEWWNKRNN